MLMRGVVLVIDYTAGDTSLLNIHIIGRRTLADIGHDDTGGRLQPRKGGRGRKGGGQWSERETGIINALSFIRSFVSRSSSPPLVLLCFLMSLIDFVPLFEEV